MRALFFFLLAAFGLPLMCGVLFIILFATFAGLTIPQLPVWAQGEARDWLLGTPQPVGSETGDNGSSPAGVGVGWDGYIDPLNPDPPRGLPLRDTVYLGCLFHDPNYTQHTGVDFPATLGTLVYTTLAGKVVWAAENGPWGNLVVVENNGYQIYLAHLETILVSVGQILPYGEAVGEVGSTGNSTGPHLHYGIKRRTEGGQVWLDPVAFFGGADYLKVVCR
jgi:murein DD-endopeptidase MepM/ murein hydrolase activator NlpD